MFKGKISLFIKYWLNPVSLFRLAEFDFVDSAADWEKKKVLDISSPILFAAYLCKNTRDTNVLLFNPDSSDLDNSKELFSNISIDRRLFTFLDSLEIKINSLDIVYSISVIEHVVDNEEEKFIENIWSFLKPGGVFILTFPVAAKNRIEYKKQNPYGLAVPQNDEGEYFYQRVYDDETMNLRIIDKWEKLGGDVISKSIIGFKEGFSFHTYMARRRKLGFREAKKDIIYASKYLRDYSNTNELPDRGVCGLVLGK
ncbi:MAG: methyltransferase domain-containing protein [Candidatus Zixiibacteriota bacterium]